MRDMLAQKKSELENLLGEYEQRLEDMDEQNQQLASERLKLKSQIQEIEEQLSLLNNNMFKFETLNIDICMLCCLLYAHEIWLLGRELAFP